MKSKILCGLVLLSMWYPYLSSAEETNGKARHSDMLNDKNDHSAVSAAVDISNLCGRRQSTTGLPVGE